MRNLQIGDRGAAVRRLQELGDLLGYDYGDNDGVFGLQTDRVVHDLQQSLGVCQDGIVGPITWRAILNQANGEPGHASVDDLGIHDISKSHKPPKLFAHLRPWSSIIGVTLHQTGCEMPLQPLGWSRVNAHYGVSRLGTPILINRPEDMIWHAQRLSPTTIGIEIDGNYEGVEGLRSTLWAPGGGPATLHPWAIDACNAIYRDIAERFEAAGQEWLAVYGHRQSSRTRRGDPGSAIWQAVGVPWRKRLACDARQCRQAFGKGRPVPRVWDANGKGEY